MSAVTGDAPAPRADLDEEEVNDAEASLPLSLRMLAPLSSAFARLAGPAAEPRPARGREPRREASYVVNRRGERVPVRFDTITARNEELRSDPAFGPELAYIDSSAITADVVRRFRNGMTTRQLDEETAAICFQLATHHTDYERLAARVLVSDLHKRTPASMGEIVEAIKAAAPTDAYLRLSEEFQGVVRRAEPVLRERLDFSRDYRFGCFGFKTLVRSYLIRSTCKQAVAGEEEPLTERPQHMYMRIAIGLFLCRPDRLGHLAPEPEFSRNLALALQLYDALSLHLVSNATPTILNAATRCPQLSSCFQNATGDDLPALFRSLTTGALCSKWSGGVSLWLHNVRSEGAPIRKTGGRSQGLGPYLRILNDVQLYVDQGGNRPGAYAMYLSVDHADIFTFLAAGRKKGEGVERFRAPDMKYAIWVPDLFMRALLAQLEAERLAAAGGAPDPSAGDWYLFCPDEDSAPGLHLVYGEEYEQLYGRYVREGRYRRKVKAGEIVAEAFKNWAQEGTPFVLFKDHVNAKSNMRNVAPICSSNICVAADTKVLTKAGQRAILDLVGQEVDVWNGAEWSAVTVRRTGEACPLVRVTLDSGAVLDCTPAHKFYVEEAHRARPVETRAHALRPGDRLEKAGKWPVIAEGRSLPHAYARGFFAAGGHYESEARRCSRRGPQGGDLCRKHLGLELAWPRDGRCRANCAARPAHLYGAQRALIDALDLHPVCPGKCEDAALDRVSANLADGLLPEYEVPFGADLRSRLEWFAGLCDGGGAIVRSGTGAAIQVASADLGFLRSVRLMLQTMGCDPEVAESHGGRARRIGGKGYQRQAPYRLRVPPCDLDQLLGLGLTCNRLSFAGCPPPSRDARRHAKVVSVAPLPGLHPTYCFTEPLRHRGVFNGILTGQCTEVLIASWSEYDAPTFARFHPDNAAGGEVGVCVLAAVCLESYVLPPARLSGSEGGACPGVATPGSAAPSFDFRGVIAAAGLEAQALNRVIDLGYHPTEECARSCRRHRPIGIGLMGLADVYARLGLAYGEPRALALARAIAACIYYGALRASARLAEAEGPYASFEGSPVSQGLLQPDLWVREGHLSPGWEEEVEVASGGALRPEDWRELREAARRGVRNVYVTAYMPTATTSNIVGQNECFEPFTSNVYTRKTLAGEFLLINRHLQNDLIAAGLWSERLRRSLLASGGSVQGVPGVPAELKRLYRTAREIHPSLFVRTLAAMSPFVCQSASLNLFLDAPDLPKILRFLVEGWRAGLKCGMYYLHTKPSAGTQKTALHMAPAADGAPFLGAPAPPAPPSEEPASCDRSGACTSCVL